MSRKSSVFALGSFVVACSAKVERFPRPGESLAAEAFTVEAGGKGFNLMVGARRLGASVDGLLAVGDDFFGQLAPPALRRAGLDHAMLRRHAAATGSGIGFTDRNSENLMAVFSGANLALSAADVAAVTPAIQASAMVLAQFEIGDEPIREAFRVATAAGVPTLLNPSPWRRIDPAILAKTSILVVNRVEAAALAAGLGVAGSVEAELPRIAAALREQGPDTLVVTLGAHGAIAVAGDAAPLTQAAFPAACVDALGAGDAFTAGFVAALVSGRTLAQSLRQAAACGALATQKLGVYEALPDRAQVDAFLAPWDQPI